MAFFHNILTSFRKNKRKHLRHKDVILIRKTSLFIVTLIMEEEKFDFVI